RSAAGAEERQVKNERRLRRGNGRPPVARAPAPPGPALMAACVLPADVDAGAGAHRAGTVHAFGILDDELDPQRVAALVVRGLIGLVQRVEAPLLLARGGGLESRQLEDYPGAVVHLRQRKGYGLPGRVDPDLGTAPNRRLPGIFELSSVTAERHGLGRRTAESREASARTGRRPGTGRPAGTGRPGATRGRAGAGRPARAGKAGE